MSTSVYSYKDHWIRACGAVLWAHFIKSLGYKDSLFEMLMEPGYFPDILVGTGITLLIWELIRQITMWLDRHYDWLEQTLMRTFLQLLLGIALPGLLVFFLMFLYFRYILSFNIFETPWLLIEYRVTLLFLFMINGYYLGYYFYLRFRLAEQRSAALEAFRAPGVMEQETAVAAPIQSLIAVKGAKNIPVLIDNIAYCYVRDETYYLKTFDEQQFMIPHTLDELETMLPATNFFRLNRQLVAHFKACAAFKNIENGKLQLTMKPAFPEPVVISQKKAAMFKEWLVSR